MDKLRKCFFVVAFTIPFLVASRSSHAVPSFAQQTGQPCAACHIGAFGPQLTPMGQEFKIGGYTLSSGEGIAAQIPLAAMALGSFTNTREAQPMPAASDFGRNNNFALDQISLFFAGRITDFAGAFIQGTYSGVDRAFQLDNTDVRVTTPLTFGQTNLQIGATLNNGPTVQDPFNSTPVWMFPFASSALAPTPTAQPLLAGGLVGNSIGLTAYAWYDHHLYVEAGGYETYGPTLLSAAGASLGPGSTANVAPYARAAWQWQWNDQAAHIGGLLLSANINPALSEHTATSMNGTNRFTDYALDASYRYLGDGRHIGTAYLLYIHENQDLSAAFNTAGSVGQSSALNQIRMNASYFYNNTYGLTVGWQYTWGPANPLMFPQAPVTGSRNGKPNSNAFIMEADWIPFGKEESWGRPFANLKIALQYTAYTLFNGGSHNYDGFGRNASGNNTIFLYAWTAF